MRESIRRFNDIDAIATGANISCLIAEKGLTDRIVAERMDITVQAIYKWRYGKCVPGFENAMKLAEILEIPVEDVYVMKSRE